MSFQWNLDDEIVVDNFAGGGGASDGIEEALGVPVNIAVNHDANAVMMHQANHPHTLHLCEDVFTVDPVAVCKGRRVKLAWFSPDCTHHSKAKGGKPRSKKIRGLAWVVIKWMGKVRPRVVCLENVKEFQDWGPLTKDGQPCKLRKGKTFRHWIRQMERLGYKVEYWVLRACDYGVPTIRERLFLVARCDGQPIVKPEPTHGDPKSDAVKQGKLKPWPVAADIIDWSLPCPSIFMDPDEAKQRGLKRPLADNTMKRIARGLQKFVFDTADPFVVTVNHGGDTFRGQGIDQPFNTVTAARDGHGVVQPFVQHVQHASSQNGTMPVDEPLRTVTATPKGGGMALSCAYLAQHNNTSADSRSAETPLSTVTNTGSQQGVIAAHVTKFRNGATGHEATDPLATVTSGGKMARPGGANPLGLVAVHLDRQFGKSEGADATDPVGTITAGGDGKTALCTSNLVKLRGTCRHGQAVTEPAPTVTAGGFHIGEVRAFLMKYYGTGEGQICDDPLGTVTSKERFGLVTIKGEQYQIVDIGMRMLTPRELYAAQGFRPDYKIGDNPEIDGFKFSKSQQVAKCGNSVCPPLAAAIVRANVQPSALHQQQGMSA
ncbi:DNA cytosine methyltransferase [Thalassospira aquimaris]|uniref:DNA (cytosine-5-)-methyltransferase n=1 Tax=Thalassospira aquimaris TaxID=3037796 RepID=A0ABT6GBL7_9PROT|nr:DNA cytosine methyltransferase [Thalassospira sp. FZY0004]MDG4719388.1 DNA cytosine methyltransferase [Thalassospira sp. FZY0004]